MCASPQLGVVVGGEAFEERIGRIGGLPQKATIADDFADEPPRLKQEQAAPHQFAAHQRFGYTQGRRRMQTIRTAKIAGMDNHVIQNDQAVDADRFGERGREQTQ